MIRATIGDLRRHTFSVSSHTWVELGRLPRRDASDAESRIAVEYRQAWSGLAGNKSSWAFAYYTESYSRIVPVASRWTKPNCQLPWQPRTTLRGQAAPCRLLITKSASWTCTTDSNSFNSRWL